MYCLKCQTQNEETNNFCKNCGANLWHIHNDKSGNDISDTFLIIFIIIAFISQITLNVMQYILPDWYSSPVKYIIGSIWILQSISFILPALAIKNNTFKTIGIILASLYVIYGLYSNIGFLIR